MSCVVELLEIDRRNVSDRAEQTPVIEPVDPRQGCPFDLVGAFADIAGHDQPVVGTGRVQRFGDGLVAGVAGVEVADSPEGGLPTVASHSHPAYVRLARLFTSLN